MKVKAGFVTNSSSTCFIFLWKGELSPEHNLYKAIKNHKNDFELEYMDLCGNMHKANAELLVNALQDILSPDAERGLLHPLKVVSIDEMIDFLEMARKSWKRIAGTDEQDEDMFWGCLVASEYLRAHRNVAKLAKKRGHTHALRIFIGQNGGDIEGEGLARAMEMEGRFLDWVKDDELVLMVDANH